MQIKTTKVVIVGAGPTGLTMAACLQQLGIDHIIMDKKLSPTKESKAMVVHARSMEVFDALGISDKFTQVGEETVNMNFVIKGNVHNTIQIKKFGEGLTKFPYILTLEQSKTEKILADIIRNGGGEVLWGAEFVSVEHQSQGQSLIEYSIEGKHFQIETDYVIGCDGARSPIRNSLDIPFDGSTESNLFYVADVKMKSDTFNKKELYISFLKEGFALIFGMAGDDHFRVIGVVPKQFEEVKDLKFSDFSQWIAEQLGNQVQFQETYWYSTYRVHSKVANSFQEGNVFLAGDACHIHTPAGGQGMNTGIQDAYNLAWKLSRVIKGKSPQSLLKTYHIERKANAINLLKTTDRMFEFMMDDNFLSNIVKRFIFPNMTKLISNTSLGSRLFFPTVSQLGTTYKVNNLRNAFSFGKIQVGDRFPYSGDAEFDSKTIGYRLTDDYRLLCLGLPVPNEIDEVECIQVDSIPSKLSYLSGSYVLLRPDNHIASIGKDVNELQQVVASL